MSGAEGTALGLPDGYRLRAWQDADLDELHALIERNKPRLARWMHWVQEQTLNDTRAFLARAQREESAGLACLRCILAADGRIAGTVGLAPIDRQNRSAQIGYWLDEAHEGRGVMTAAVAVLARNAFDQHRLNRVEIRADVENRPSCAVAERLGFKFEGVLRQSYRVVAERYSDDAVYAMLASETGVMPAPE